AVPASRRAARISLGTQRTGQLLDVLAVRSVQLQLERSGRRLGNDIDSLRTRQNSSKPPCVIRNVGILPFTGEAGGELIGTGLHDVLDDSMNAEVVREEILS